MQLWKRCPRRQAQQQQGRGLLATYVRLNVQNLKSNGQFFTNFRKSDVREIKVMRTRDQRFTDIAPKVYHTICNPYKVCVLHFATRIAL